MKKLISILLALALCCMMIPALAEDGITGDWYGEYSGMVMKLTLNEDGTAAMEVSGMDMGSNAGWTLDGDRFTLTVDGTPTEGTYTDGSIQLPEYEGGPIVAFGRDPIEGFIPAEVNPEAAAEDYDGTWESTYGSFDGLIMGLSGESRETITIEGGKVTLLNPNGGAAFFLGTDPIEMTYENGALVYTQEIANDAEPIVFIFKIEMLQDGMIAMSMDMGYGASMYYLSKVEAE